MVRGGVLNGERQDVEWLEAGFRRVRCRVLKGERRAVQARSPNSLKSYYYLYHICLSVCNKALPLNGFS